MLELPYARRAQRRTVDLSCDLIGQEYDAPLTHSLRDLSAYGAWLTTSFPMKVGDIVVLSFRPPNWEKPFDLNVFAEVTRTAGTHRSHGRHRRGGMGLAFMDLTTPERRMMQRCLRTMAQSKDGRSFH